VIGLIVLGLAFLFFLVVAFFAAKTWHVGHVVAMVFLFLFTLVMLFLTATLFRTHQNFRPEYDADIESLEQEQKRHQTLLYGSRLGVPAGDGSLYGEQALARVEQFGRGRIWRHVFGQINPLNPGIVLKMSQWNNDGCLTVGKEEDFDEGIEPVADEAVADAADGGDAATAVVSPHGIVDGQFLYAFKEYPVRFMTPAEKEYYFGALSNGEESFADKDKRNRCRIPSVYLGKFRVTGLTDQNVSVVPETPLDQFQMRQIGNNDSWVLYEKLPTDSHDLFGGVEPENLSGLISLKRLNDFGVPLSQQAYQGMLDEYVRDGKEFTQRVNDPLRLAVQVRFKQPYEVVVDLEVEGDLPETNQPFNVEGRAQVRNLIQEEATKFAQGDTAVFDDQTATELVQQGIAERVGNPTYSRQLHDFENAMNDQQVRFIELTDDLGVVTAEVDALNSSLNRLQEQVDKLRAEVQLLQQDFDGFGAERTELSKYFERLRDRRSYLEQEIDRLVVAVDPVSLVGPLASR